MLTRMILFAYELVLKRAFSYKVLVQSSRGAFAENVNF